MKKLIKKAAAAIGYQIKPNIFDKHRDGFVNLRPDCVSNGNVLLAYIIDPFLLQDGQKIPNSHTHFWESTQIAKNFLNLGYSVDVISYRNPIFKPTKNYDIFLSARTNFQRISKLLNGDCIKIVNLDMAHWVVNNFAAYQRCINVFERRKAVIKNYKLQDENLAIECADYGTVLGNQFTLNTYRYANKPLFRVPLPTLATFPLFEDKNFDTIRRNYLWFGSHGFVHKGLDLVLEAFAQMPGYNLTVCGPIDKENDFKEVYTKELYQTPNINTIGWVDIDSEEFEGILKKCVGTVYPSCAEGGGGSVITCMQGGLIPIVTYEASIDVVDDYGFILKKPSIDEIQKTVCFLSGMPAESLKNMSNKAREYVRKNHTKDVFAKRHHDVIDTIIKKGKKR